MKKKKKTKTIRILRLVVQIFFLLLIAPGCPQDQRRHQQNDGFHRSLLFQFHVQLANEDPENIRSDVTHRKGGHGAGVGLEQGVAPLEHGLARGELGHVDGPAVDELLQPAGNEIRRAADRHLPRDRGAGGRPRGPRRLPLRGRACGFER